MNSIKLLSAVLIGLSLTACKKDTDEPSDKTLPSINKVQPAFMHQAYDFGDTAYFQIEFSDNASLKETSLKLYLETGETILYLQQFPNAATDRIDTFVIMNDPRFGDLDFDIKAIDASDNVAMQSSHIHLR